MMGHANTMTTEHIYTHLFDTDDHADAMTALGEIVVAAPSRNYGDNVIQLRS